MMMMKVKEIPTYEGVGSKNRGRIKEKGLNDIRFNSPYPIYPPRQPQFTSGATARQPSVF